MKRITPDFINSLGKDEIFVFGSNLSGIHGAGAAFIANKKFGAKLGIGIGISGNSYAIPTKSEYIKRTLSIDEIRPHVSNFVKYAIDHPSKNFLVTKIGCGLAGHSIKDIARLFIESGAFNEENIAFPEEFWTLLKLN